MQRRLLALLAVPVVAGVVAGCGADGSAPSHASTPATGGQTLRLTANPAGALEFSPTSLTARPGTITLVMRNPSSSGEEHGIAVKGHGVDKQGAIVGPGGTSTLTLTLQRGVYEYYCPFDHHAQSGMTGTLTVQ